MTLSKFYLFIILGKTRVVVHVNWVVTSYRYLLHVEIAIIFGTTSFQGDVLVRMLNGSRIILVKFCVAVTV